MWQQKPDYARYEEKSNGEGLIVNELVSVASFINIADRDDQGLPLWFWLDIV